MKCLCGSFLHLEAIRREALKLNISTLPIQISCYKTTNPKVETAAQTRLRTMIAQSCSKKNEKNESPKLRAGLGTLKNCSNQDGSGLETVQTNMDLKLSSEQREVV